MSADPPFRFPVRVYWEDTDAGGVVFYANYLKYFERSRTEWLRARGVEQQALREREGAIFVVSDLRVRYLLPARLDDQLDIDATLQASGRASLDFMQQAWRGTTLLAQADVRVACVDATSLRPRRIPRFLLDRLE